MREQRFPPGPSTWRAMRGLRDMGGGRDLSSVPRFFREVAAAYGGIAHWTILGRHYFLVDEPAAIEELLVTHASDYRKGRGIERLRRLLGDGLLTSEAPRHLTNRRMLQPAFHRERIEVYGARMTAAAQAHVDAWSDGAALDLDAEMARLTLTIAAETLFSANVSASTDAIRAALTEAMRSFPASMSAIGGLLDAFPILPVTRRFYRARRRLDAVIYGLIAERRRAAAPPQDDLLAMLLAARDERDGGLDDAAVRDEAMTMFLAGHETTANALTWTWTLLAAHSEAEAALHAEIDAVLGGRPPQAADVPRLPFTRAVFAEALRLYPPAWVLGRRALRDGSIGGWTVPAGSIVIASPLVTQRNPRYWAAPEAFRPERWTAEPNEMPRFAYFPFGGGNRLCIGEPFAWMEGVLVLADVARRWRFRLTGGIPAIEPLVTLRPRGPVRAVAERRVRAGVRG